MSGRDDGGGASERFTVRLRDPRPLLLDAAMGTELERCGVATRLPLWSAAALQDAPQIVAQIHADHVAAGAEIVTTNTFRTQRRTLARAGLGERTAAFVRLAVSLARSARPAFVAGSIAPLEDCYAPELVPSDAECVREHREQAELLAKFGVDLLLVETMNTIREAVAAARAAVATGLPTIVSFVCRTDGRLFSGERVSDAARALLDDPKCRGSREGGLTALGINCTPAVTLHEPLAELSLAVAGKLPLAAYANIGCCNDIDGWTRTDEVAPKRYATLASRWIELGARIVGGCCGTDRDHLAELIRWS